MAEHEEQNARFVTVSMADILLDQQLVDQAAEIIKQLKEKAPLNKRVVALEKRLLEIIEQGPQVQLPLAPTDSNWVTLIKEATSLEIKWEITENGLASAKRMVRYSGHNILRLFSAVPGQRGVRKSTRDIELDHLAARMVLSGLPYPGVFVAAVGFLGNTGEFVPLAHSESLVVAP